ncbi:threonine--tRNA ligase [bacterium 3DAC]|nr:threonine--tRNA ligase [bacterium 3DAC]
MAVVKIDGKEYEFEGQKQLFEFVPVSKKKKIIAAKVDGTPVDLSYTVTGGENVEWIYIDSEEGLDILRHSAAHIMAQAVKHLYGKDVKLGVGPTIKDGFYYDMLVPGGISAEDLPKIEEEMRNIVKADYPFERIEVSKEEAKRIMKEAGEIFKLEIIDDIEGDTVSLYKQGDFVDLCRGPHIPSTGFLKHFKLLSVSGAYWRGDENREMLTRVYGTAWAKKEDLEAYLHQREEAIRRDHRKIGKEQDLFSIQEDIGPGLVLWHPRGGMVRKVIEDFWREVHWQRGYDFVYTPHIAKIHLWDISGHLDHYRQNMFPPMDVEGHEYMVKPMNCPFHIQIYKSRQRSYKELPLRWAEMGTVYRYEKSGVLHGLLRVRGFTQDDAHVFCTPDQIEDEIKEVLDLALFMFRTFGFDEYDIELSVRDDTNKKGYVGEDEIWEIAEKALVKALEDMKLPYKRMEGEAKFYGPAIDIKLKDAIGRSWQAATVQLDFNLPRRFGMTYIGPDGKEHEPVMIHRALLGSFERFFGTLIEQYAGAFPTWLHPEQVIVIPIADAQVDYAKEVYNTLRSQMIRAVIDLDTGAKLGARIRKAQLMKIPYMLIIGTREMEAGNVSVRHRHFGDVGAMPVGEFVEKIKAEIASRERTPSWINK